MPNPTEILIRFEQSQPPIHCGSLAEMDSELDRLHAERVEDLNKGVWDCALHVTISFLCHEINLGLGSDVSFVMIGTQPFDDWYCAASGKEDDGEEKMFYGVGQDSYWPSSRLIPIDAAREAVRFFVSHQERSPLLSWDY